VIYLALLQRTDASAGTTAFIMLAHDLATVAPWLETIASLKPAIFAFLRDFHRHNFICSSLARVAHYPVICYEDNFSDEYAADTDEYPAKVILLAGTTSPGTIGRLHRMRVPPICLADNPSTQERIHAANISATLLSDIQVETLNARIGRIFQIPPEALAELGYSQQQHRS
jgi:hypothetical protein